MKNHSWWHYLLTAVWMALRGSFLVAAGGGLLWGGGQLYCRWPEPLGLLMLGMLGGCGLSLFLIGVGEAALTIFSKRENRAHCFFCRSETRPEKILKPAAA